LLLKVNYSPLRVKKSRSHDMGHYLVDSISYYFFQKPQIERNFNAIT
jgi:hypothetical protein